MVLDRFRFKSRKFLLCNASSVLTPPSLGSLFIVHAFLLKVSFQPSSFWAPGPEALSLHPGPCRALCFGPCFPGFIAVGPVLGPALFSLCGLPYFPFVGRPYGINCLRQSPACEVWSSGSKHPPAQEGELWQFDTCKKQYLLKDSGGHQNRKKEGLKKAAHGWTQKLTIYTRFGEVACNYVPQFPRFWRGGRRI